MTDRRFRIAFSFAGEKRDYVELVAQILAEKFGQEKILYDKYHEAEFARFNLGIYLPRLYGEQSDLIVPVLCTNYDQKRWTGWEWGHIYGLLTNADGHRVMPSRFEHSHADGLSPTAGFIQLDDKTPEEFATLIVERLALNEGHPRDYYTKSLALRKKPHSTSTSNRYPRNQESKYGALFGPLVGPSQDVAGDTNERIDESHTFSEAIRTRMAVLNRRVESLTSEQFDVIQNLRGQLRVRIAGCAGSGKTLVAAEKAIRLSNAGLLTLFLCHSPLLANHLTKLTLGSAVTVSAFCEWVNQLSGNQDTRQHRWTTFEEPSEDELIQALAELEHSDLKYDAIIVDEGQDFREEWWGLVEAALRSTAAGILYIFHDDHQALLTHRATYPISLPLLNMSRNCRNAGRIYQLLQLVHPQAPRPDSELESLGERYLTTFARDDASNSIREAMQWLTTLKDNELPIVLTTGSTPFGQSPFADLCVEVGQPNQWQREVRIIFGSIAKSPICRIDSRTLNEVLDGLSDSSGPTAADLQLVQGICRSFFVPPESRRLSRDSSDASLTWILKDGQARLWRRHNRNAKFNASDVILFFEKDDWNRHLPMPAAFRFRDALLKPAGDEIPVHHVSEFKGMEADLVLLYADGPTTLTRALAYVGISRARFGLALLVDIQVASGLPYAMRDLVLRHDL